MDLCILNSAFLYLILHSRPQSLNLISSDLFLNQLEITFFADIDAVLFFQLRLDPPVSVERIFSENLIDGVHDQNVFRIDRRLVVDA